MQIRIDTAVDVPYERKRFDKWKTKGSENLKKGTKIIIYRTVRYIRKNLLYRDLLVPLPPRTTVFTMSLRRYVRILVSTMVLCTVQ